MAFLGALFFGFVPMFIYAAFVNWLDRYEKEPKLLLGAAFARVHAGLVEYHQLKVMVFEGATISITLRQ